MSAAINEIQTIFASASTATPLLPGFSADPGYGRSLKVYWA